MPVIVDDDVFASDANDDNAIESFVVQAAAPDASRVRQALERAAVRLRLVDGLGVEHAEDEDDSGWYEREGMAGHTCKYVSDVEETVEGLEVTLDCQSVIPEPMGEAFVRILREELARAGVEDARIAVPAWLRGATADEEDDEVPRWVRPFSAEGGRPIGLPADLPLPADGVVVEVEAGTVSCSTMMQVHHDGSWMASMVFAVADAEQALAQFVAGAAEAGYTVVRQGLFQHPQGHAISGVYFEGDGIELEASCIAAPAPAELDRAWRKRHPDKGALRVAAYQRDPTA